jgi:hypothetical protein
MKQVWTEEMLALLMDGVRNGKPMMWILEKVREIDPSVSYAAVKYKCRQETAANLIPYWIQSTSAKRGKPK